MTEYEIGTTELRQKLTDVIQSVREENAAYVVETFGRPQVVIISLEEYQQLLQQRRASLAETASQAVTAFGLWSNRNDVDDEWLEEGCRRWESSWEKPDTSDG